MTLIEYESRAIKSKIVYYGPHLSGKTANLRRIYRITNPGARTELVALVPEHDPELSFDFLPLQLGEVRGFKTFFHLYSVPGRPRHAASRRLILTNVDGLIFVCDTQGERLDDNLASMSELQHFLAEQGRKVTSLPLVIQYNKRDLPTALDLPTLNSRLNVVAAPVVESVAVRGEGVFESMKAVAKLVLQELHRGTPDAPRGL
jgi:mutual gliding-motility protein MglA